MRETVSQMCFIVYMEHEGSVVRLRLWAQLHKQHTILYIQTSANYSFGHCHTVDTQKQQSKINSA